MFVFEHGVYDKATDTYSLPEPLLLGLSLKGKELLRSLQDEHRADMWELIKFLVPTIISIIALKE